MAGNGVASSRSSALIRRELNRFFLSGVKWMGRPSLGVGAYGSVEPLELNGMLCAGKKIHDILVDVGNEGAEDIAARFVEECKLMSELRHPHVVQFLGLCISPSSPLPILVMEHLYCSLDDLLESSADIPLYMKRSILRDVALGLAHLHGRHPAIIHRDLTARNVLLNNDMQAKLADFGVARILNLPVGKLEATLSRVPGTSTYMPPEVFNREAKYNTAVDIFSYGHLLLFTITQKQPGVEAATYVDGSGRIVARSELERREDSVARLYGILGKEHPFVSIVTDCLQTNAALRPTILQVLNQLEGMKSSVRDPYSRQTRLTLTQMIRKKAAENKRIAAELKAAQEDLLNAKKRIVHLTDKLHRYSQQMQPVQSPNDPSKPSYYNTVDGFLSKALDKKNDTYEYIAEGSEEPFEPRSSPLYSSNSVLTSTPPPIPLSPRPTCVSPDDYDTGQPMSSFHGQYPHTVPLLQPSSDITAADPPFLSLPRTMNSRNKSKSQDNLHSDPSYVKVEDVPHQRQNSSGTPARTSPFLTRGFSSSESESDSDFDEFEPNFLRRSPKGITLQPFPPLKVGSLPSPSGGPSSLHHTISNPGVDSRYNTHPPNYSSHYSTSPTSSHHHHQTSHHHSRHHTSSPYNSGGTGGGGSGSAGPSSFSTANPPLSLSSTSSQSSTTYDSVPRVSVKTPDVTIDSSTLKPLTTGMAGKIHFYTDLEPSTLLLLQNTEQGKIPGVRYETDTGQVQIESDSSEKTKMASEKFRGAYVYATSNQVSAFVDVPGDVTESAVEEIISKQTPQYGKSTVSYNGIESSLQVLSFSGGELTRLKQALEEAIRKASASTMAGTRPLPDSSSTSSHISGRTRLSIKKGSLGSEDSDVIVFPNTSNLACKDGVAKAVDDISQGTILKQCKTFITKHGLLGFGETILMKGGGGHLRAKYVIHVNPGVGSCINLQSVLRKLVTQALKLASGKSVSSISFCPLVPNWTDANIELIAQTMLESMKNFANDKKGKKIRDIRIVVREQVAFDCFSECAKLS